MSVSVFSLIMDSAVSVGKKIWQVTRSAYPQHLSCKHSRYRVIPIGIASVTYRMGVGVQAGQALCLCSDFLKSSTVWSIKLNLHVKE